MPRHRVSAGLVRGGVRITSLFVRDAVGIARVYFSPVGARRLPENFPHAMPPASRERGKFSPQRSREIEFGGAGRAGEGGAGRGAAERALVDRREHDPAGRRHAALPGTDGFAELRGDGGLDAQ